MNTLSTNQRAVYRGLLDSAQFTILTTGRLGHVDLKNHAHNVGTFARDLARTFDYPSAIARFDEDYFIEWYLLRSTLPLDKAICKAIKRVIAFNNEYDIKIIRDILTSGAADLHNARLCVHELEALKEIPAPVAYNWLTQYLV